MGVAYSDPVHFHNKHLIFKNKNLTVYHLLSIVPFSPPPLSQFFYKYLVGKVTKENKLGSNELVSYVNVEKLYLHSKRSNTTGKCIYYQVD